MSNDTYLLGLLAEQDLNTAELDALRNLRDRIEGRLRSSLQGVQRVYYAGSFGKKTIIRVHYDLDIVVYWANDCGYSLKDIYEAVGQLLRKDWTSVNHKTVAWEIPFQGGFHIDVVPGRALDNTYRYASLYRRDTGTSLQTSIKVHIDTVRNSGRQDVIRLMKLWRAKRGVPFKKSLALELMTIDGCKGLRSDEIENQLTSTLIHVRDNILIARIVDPANSNNVLSDEISTGERQLIKATADAAIRARYWSEVLT